MLVQDPSGANKHLYERPPDIRRLWYGSLVDELDPGHRFKDEHTQKMSELTGRGTYSVVIPVFSSERILAELVVQLAQTVPALSVGYEVILVNDGSRDYSWDVICRCLISL